MPREGLEAATGVNRHRCAEDGQCCPRLMCPSTETPFTEQLAPAEARRRYRNSARREGSGDGDKDQDEHETQTGPMCGVAGCTRFLRDEECPVLVEDCRQRTHTAFWADPASATKEAGGAEVQEHQWAGSERLPA